MEFVYLGIFVPEGQPAPARTILDRPEIRVYCADWGRKGDRGVKAVAAGEAVGAAWLRVWSAEARGYGWVDDETPELSISIRPEFRGRGLGTKLLEALLSDEMGRVSLSVTKANPAVRLYERFGFETVHDDGETLTMLRNFNG